MWYLAFGPTTKLEDCGSGMPWGFSGHHTLAVHNTTLPSTELASAEAKIHILSMLYSTLTA